MPVTDIAGFVGSTTVSLAGFNATFDGWSITVTTETAVYSIFGNQWKSSKLGTSQLTGSATGTLKFDAASTTPMPLTGSDIDVASFSGATTLTAVTGCTISGTMNYTNVRIGKPDAGGKSEFSADFESDGAAQIAWDETG